MITMAWLVPSVTVGLGLALGGIAVGAWWRAAGHGWAREFGHGATSIFDEHEPLGVMTDRFPSQTVRRARDPERPPAAGRVGD